MKFKTKENSGKTLADKKYQPDYEKTLTCDEKFAVSDKTGLLATLANIYYFSNKYQRDQIEFTVVGQNNTMLDELKKNLESVKSKIPNITIKFYNITAKDTNNSQRY